MKASQIIIIITNIMTTKICEDFIQNVQKADMEICILSLLPEDNPLEYLSSNISDEKGIIIITDDKKICDYSLKKGLACLPVIHEYNKNEDFSKALYVAECPLCLSLRDVNRIYQRYLYFPWTICETERLIIREQTVEDIDELYRIYDDDDVRSNTESLYEDVNDEIQYVKDYIDKQYRFFEYGVWVLIRKSDGKLIGRAGLSNRDGFDDVEIGYVIGREYRRCGYAFEALTAIIKYAKDELLFERFNAFTLSSNVPGKALLTKLGFKKVGGAFILGKMHERWHA